MSPETLSGHSEACKATQLAFNFDLSGSPDPMQQSSWRFEAALSWNQTQNWKSFIPTTPTHLTPKQREDNTGLSLAYYPHAAPGCDVCIITQASAFMRSLTARCKHLIFKRTSSGKPRLRPPQDEPTSQTYCDVPPHPPTPGSGWARR